MRGAGRERQYEGLVVVVLECRRGSELTSGGLSSSSLYLSSRLRKSEDSLATSIPTTSPDFVVRYPVDGERILLNGSW